MPETSMTDRAWRLDAVGANHLSSEMDKAAQLAPGSGTGPMDWSSGPDAERRKPAGFIRRCNQVVRTWASVRLERFGIQTGRFEAVLHEFAGSIQTANDSVTVAAALLRQAQQMVPAFRIELLTKATPSFDQGVLAEGDGSGSGDGRSPSHRGDGQGGQSILELPLRCGSDVRGWLRIRPRARGVASLRKETIRRLNTLCTLGACALERLDHHEEWPEPGESARAGDPAEVDPAAGAGEACARFVDTTQLHDATFLNAVLPFALNQARRHNEPLSFVCVAIDRLGGIQELLGRAAVDQLVKSVGETVASLIRASDIVARLDDDRIVAVLPRAPGGGALHVAQRICQVVAEKNHDDCEIPRVTVSIGVATFPSCADNVFSLFDAADEALAKAQNQGRNQASLAPRRPALVSCPGAARQSSPVAT